VLPRLLQIACALTLIGATASQPAVSEEPGRPVEFQGLRYRVSDRLVNRLELLIQSAKIGNAFNQGRYCLNRGCENKLSIFVIWRNDPSAHTVELTRLDAAYDPNRDAIYLHPSLIEPIKPQDWQTCLATPSPAPNCGPTYYLAFLLFHELGHRALGSRLRVMFHFAGGYSLEQMDEVDADAWGIHTLASTLFPNSKRLQADLGEAVVRAAMLNYFAETAPLDRISVGHPSMLVRLQLLARAASNDSPPQDSTSSLLDNLVPQTEAYRRYVLRAPEGHRLVDAAACRVGFVAVSQTGHLLAVFRARAESVYWGAFLPGPGGGKDPKTWRDYADLEFRDAGSVLEGMQADQNGLRIRCNGENVVITGVNPTDGTGVSEFLRLTPSGIEAPRIVKSPACTGGMDLGFLSTADGVTSARACLADNSFVDVSIAEAAKGTVTRLHLRIPPGITVNRNYLIGIRSDNLLVQTNTGGSWEVIAVRPGRRPAVSVVSTAPAFWELCLGRHGLAAMGGDPESFTLAASEYPGDPGPSQHYCGYQEANEVGRTATELLSVLQNYKGDAHARSSDGHIVQISNQQCELIVGPRFGGTVWVFGEFGASGVSEAAIDKIHGCNMPVGAGTPPKP
jgi:hypothetical protein